jgi:hypothetical protein
MMTDLQCREGTKNDAPRHDYGFILAKPAPFLCGNKALCLANSKLGIDFTVQLLVSRALVDRSLRPFLQALFNLIWTNLGRNTHAI